MKNLDSRVWIIFQSEMMWNKRIKEYFGTKWLSCQIIIVRFLIVLYYMPLLWYTLIYLYI